MNVIRQLTPVSDASRPPSPTTTDSSKNGTNDVVLAQQLCLKHIFTDQVYDHICAAKRSSGNPLANSAMRYVQKQSRSLGDYDSVEELLRHYGIRIQQQPSRFRSIVQWILRCILPFTTTTTAVVDPVRTIAVLAAIFLQENPDGGLGYSFGTLLQHYITRHLVLEYSLLKDIQYNLVWGAGPFFIPNGYHAKSVERVERDGQDDVDVNLHLVRGKHVASSGPGSLLDRVQQDLGDLIEKGDRFVYLCHGTTVENASSIVREGPAIHAGALSADFGQAFYLAESFEYALLAAHQAKAVSGTRLECAVLVFPVRKSVLQECRQLLDLRNDPDRWADVVKNGISNLRFENRALDREHENAQCIVGPTVRNFEQVHSARAEPRQSRYVQWAFPKRSFIRDVLTAIIESGNLHFLRFIHDYEHEWESTTGETLRGLRRK